MKDPGSQEGVEWPEWRWSVESAEWPGERRAAMLGQPLQSHMVALVGLPPATIRLTC